MSEKPVRKLTSDINCSIHNKFEFEVIDAETKEVKQRAEAYNVICDTFWQVLLERMNNRAGSQSVFRSVVLGSGTGTPSVTDTVLFNKLKSYDNWVNTSDWLYYGSTVDLKFPSPGTVCVKRKITIQADDLVNQNLSEIGLSNDGTNIVTHAMLQDMNGNPLVIHKTEHDIINIFPMIYIHFSSNGYNGILIPVPANEDGRTGASRNYGYSSNSNLFLSILGLTDGNTHFAGNANSIGGANARGMLIEDGRGGGIYQSIDIQNKQMTTIVYRFLQEKLNAPIAFIFYTIGHGVDGNSERAIDYSDLMFLPECFPTSQLSISEEPVGTGDGITTNFSTKFPIKSNTHIYIDGVLQNSGVDVLFGGYQNDSADSAIIVSGLFEYYYHGMRTMLHCLNRWSGAGRGSTRVTFHPSHSDFIIIKNPEHREFNSIKYDFIVRNLNEGITWYIDISSDGNTWTTIDTQTPTGTGHNVKTYSFQSPSSSEYIRFRWEILNPDNTAMDEVLTGLNWVDFYNDTYGPCNIHFNTPPAAGAVITVDYLPDCIPKDENHVLDVGFTIQFGAYTGSGV